MAAPRFIWRSRFQRLKLTCVRKNSCARVSTWFHRPRTGISGIARCFFAIQMAIYIAHDWQSYGEVSEAEMNATPQDRIPDYQARDVTHAEMVEKINERLEPEETGRVW